MGYRDASEAASARIEALEHEIHALRARVAPAVETPDPSRLTTPRERALTHELAVSRSEIESLRRESRRLVPRSRSTLAIAFLGIVVLGVGAMMLLAIAGEHAAHRPTRSLAAVTEAPSPATPAVVSQAPAAEPVCDAP